VQVTLDDGAPLIRYRLVDDPTWRDVSAGDRADTVIVVPPCSAAVVI
jgi:hypothetical protein